jgi:uncharacterized membrane protein YoaK (UPF0700 family)
MTLPATEVTSRRHLPSWMLLAFTAGSVNAIAFLACERFVAHVTGIVTRIGMDVGAWTLMLDYAFVLSCFVIGATVATVLVKRGAPEQAGERAWLPLALVTTLLATVALAGHLGAFGHFGGTVESLRDFALLSILAFTMGAQNAAAALRSGMAVRTTHMTGPSTDLAIGLGTMLTSSGASRREPIAGIVMRGSKILAFVIGAAATDPIARHAGFAAFALPALTCAVAMLSSFVPERFTSSLSTLLVRTNRQETR